MQPAVEPLPIPGTHILPFPIVSFEHTHLPPTQTASGLLHKPETSQTSNIGYSVPRLASVVDRATVDTVDRRVAVTEEGAVVG